MKKLVVGAVVLVLLLAVAPFAIGRLAEQRIERGLDQMVVEMPFLRIAERKYHGGWFNSELDVTYELFSGLGTGGVPAPTMKMHHDIRHGPVLGAGVGMALVKTRFELEPSTRRDLEKVFGTDEPFDIQTTIGFFGGATTVISSDANEYESEAAKVSWDELKVVIDTSGKGDAFTMDGKWPRIEGRNPDGSEFAMRGMRVTGAGKRLVGNLFDTDLDFAIEEVRVTSAEQSMLVKDAHYIAVTEPHGDLVDLSVKVGSGVFNAASLNLTELHYDFTLRGLHAATFDKLMTAMKGAYMDSAKTPYQVEALELLKRDPVLVIDRLGFATEEGAGAITGTVRLKGVTAQDLEAGSMALMTRVVADLDLDMAEAVVTKLAGNTEPADGMVKQGFVERKEGRLVSKILFQDGKLLINGKEQAIPGLGGPPPVSPTSQE